MALSPSAASDLLDAFRAGDGAEEEVDGLIGKKTASLEADVDDPGVRARGEHGCSRAAHVGGEEALVVDLEVDGHVVAVPAVPLLQR